MHLADLVADAGVKQDALGSGGLAGVDVGADADVAVALNGVLRLMTISSVRNYDDQNILQRL
ncbi:hypothetical protein [Collimonas sp. PA-H2]|uniref:hypothetical protein n=1 Tax=Collimonas sp. PA-H2 TaxID=1881062 RepID=UPI001E60A091|nr:hypothetical protein [Collimonas sp. PA-H2]